jgi:hypothetical protein
MVAAAWAGAADADRVVLLVDAARPDEPDTRRIVDQLVASGRRAVLALNKVDLVRRDTLLGVADTLYRAGCFDDVFMISGLKGDGVEDLKRHLAAVMPPGPWLFPEDQLSDAAERWLAAEITREQVFLQLHDELPHAASVETEAWEERRDGSVRIDQVLYVRRPGQRAIVLGDKGQRIKTIAPAPAPNWSGCWIAACTCSCSSRCATTGSRTRALRRHRSRLQCLRSALPRQPSPALRRGWLAHEKGKTGEGACASRLARPHPPSLPDGGGVSGAASAERKTFQLHLDGLARHRLRPRPGDTASGLIVEL